MTACCRTSEGRNIVAGVNTGFFESNLGFPRASTSNTTNPSTQQPLRTRGYLHTPPGFTFFEDRSVSFSNRDFTGMVKSGDTEVEYYSVNDTIVALSNKVPSDTNTARRQTSTPRASSMNPTPESTIR